MTRQGKKLPIYLNSDGLVKIYQKSIFDSGLNKRSTFAENFSIVNLTRSSKNSLFANNKSKKLFQSIKNYNKQYYIGLKFKAEKIKGLLEFRAHLNDRTKFSRTKLKDGLI